MTIPAVAKKEQVVKGTLYEQCKQPVPPSYLVQIQGGQWKVDIDNPEWISYLANYHAKKNYINSDKLKFNALKESIVESVKELLDLDSKTMNQLFILMGEKYEEKVNGQ